eukprot:4130085-Pyramimonas_sp.AAC.1
MSTYELLSYLCPKGWYGEVWHDKTTHPGPVQVSTGAPKLWWIRSGSVCLVRNYLLVPCQLDSIEEEEVMHLKSSSYYKKLLRGESRK